MNEQEQRIREFAYEIWQTEGCPEGQGARHWEMARKLVEQPSTEQPATETAQAAKAPKATKPAKAASAAKGNAKPKPAAGTEAAEGTPAGVKRTRTPRAKKDS